MNKPRVFADFHNADAKGRVRLNCAGTVADLKRQKIVLQDGQPLIIYSEELEVTGVVHWILAFAKTPYEGHSVVGVGSPNPYESVRFFYVFCECEKLIKK